MRIKQGQVIRASAIDTLRIKVGVDARMKDIMDKRLSDYMSTDKPITLSSNNIGDKKFMRKNPTLLIYLLNFCRSALGVKGITIKSAGMRADNRTSKIYDYEVTVNIMDMMHSLRRTKLSVKSPKDLLNELLDSTIFAYIKHDNTIITTHLDAMTHMNKVSDTLFNEVYNNEILGVDVDFNEVTSEYLFAYISTVLTSIFSLSGLFIRLFDIDSIILSINIKEKYNLDNSPHLYYRLLACMNMLDVLSNTESSDMNLGGASVSLDNIRKYEIQKSSSRSHVTIDPNRDPSSYIFTEKSMGNSEVPFSYSVFPYDKLKNKIAIDRSIDTPMHRMVQPSYCIDDFFYIDNSDDELDGTVSINTYINITKILANIDRKSNPLRKDDNSDNIEDDNDDPTIFTHVPSTFLKSIPTKFEYGYDDIYKILKVSLDQIIEMSSMMTSTNRFKRYTRAIHLGTSIVFYEKLNFIINNPKYIKRAYPSLGVLSLKGYMGSMIDYEDFDVHKGVLNYMYGAMKRNPNLEMLQPDYTESGKPRYLTIRKLIDHIEGFFKYSEDSSKFIVEAQFIIMKVILATSKSIFMTPMDENVCVYWSKLLFTLFNIDFKTIEENPSATGKIKRAIKSKYIKWLNDTYNPLEEDYVRDTKILDPVLSAKLFKSILDNSLLSKKYKNINLLEMVNKI